MLYICIVLIRPVLVTFEMNFSKSIFLAKLRAVDNNNGSTMVQLNELLVLSAY